MKPSNVNSLFDESEGESAAPPSKPALDAPLAARMRPRTLEEFAGQHSIVAPGSLLYTAIEQDRLPSVIFWGPPGCGKSTLAEIMANRTRSAFERLSAVTSGVADLR